MSKPYADMTLNDLRAERAKYVDSQKTAGGDYSWWGSQSQIDAVDKAIEELFREKVKHLYAEHGINKTIKYLNKLHDVQLAQKELKTKAAEL